MIRTVVLLMSVTYSFAQQGNPGCLLQPVEGDPRMFQVNAPLRGNRRFPCPTNTLFDPKQCGCGWVDNPVNYTPNQINGGISGGGNSAFGMVDRTVNTMGGNTGMGNGMGMGMGMGGPGGVGGGAGGVIDMTPEPVSTTRAPCTLRAHIDSHMYEQFIMGFDWMVRRCPMGTLFNQEACACHGIDPNQKYTCHPELWINFNGREIEDSAGYQISVGNNGNVVNMSNAGRFDGTGTLTVWQYANQDLGTGLTINLRFYEFPGGQAPEQVLISNCYGRQVGSIEIALDTKNLMVIFRVEAKVGRYPEGIEIQIPYRDKSWKNVTLSYDGNEVRAKVDDEFKSAPLKGHITTRYNGLLIGSCNGRGYVGYIDDLRLYRCLLDQNMNTGIAGNADMASRMDPMMNAGGPMMNAGGPMMNGGGPMMNGGGPMMNGGGPMVNGGGPMMNGGGPMMNAGGPMVNAGGPMMNAGGPMV